MKNIITIIGTIIIASFLMTSCDQNSSKQKELELKERELAIKEKELSLKEKDTANSNDPQKMIVGTWQCDDNNEYLSSIIINGEGGEIYSITINSKNGIHGNYKGVFKNYMGQMYMEGCDYNLEILPKAKKIKYWGHYYSKK